MLAGGGASQETSSFRSATRDQRCRTGSKFVERDQSAPGPGKYDVSDMIRGGIRRETLLDVTVHHTHQWHNAPSPLWYLDWETKTTQHRFT